MPIIDRDRIQERMNKNRHLILLDVLSPEQYEESHLQGAINVPLSTDFEETVQEAIPDKNAEIVVYCSDAECDASPTAARKMEDLGYQRLYHYSGGKENWKAAGLPMDR